jgi:hypothetical protein
VVEIDPFSSLNRPILDQFVVEGRPRLARSSAPV